MRSKSDKKNIYVFNLKSKKSKEEVKKIQSRDESTFYTFILVFLAAFIYLLLTLLDFALVKTKIDNTSEVISSTEAQIESKSEIQSLNGELFVKSSLLTPLLEKDIKLQQFLEIASTFLNDDDILNYSREATGVFVVQHLVDNEADIIKIINDGESLEEIDYINVREFRFDNTVTEKYIAVFEISLVIQSELNEA